MRIYLDSCALNRLFDDRTQTRVRLEAEAIEDFFSLFAQRKVDWIASEVVEHEMRNNRNQVVQNDTLQLLAICSERVRLDHQAFQRGEDLEQLGYGPFDALHLACAEDSKADFLLTTDDRFQRQAKRRLGNPATRVIKPVNWMKESAP